MDDHDRDRAEIALFMAVEPKPGQVSEDRHVSVVELERDHEVQRRERARLAADGDWVE